MSDSNKPLSRRFAQAYAISRSAPPDDSSLYVKNARKALRKMKSEFKKKIKEEKELCEAATIVGIPQRTMICQMVSRIQHDRSRLEEELKRISSS
jgi:hypothetical protein